MTRRRNAGYVCALLALVLPWVYPSKLHADDQTPPARVARLSYLRGSVSLQPSGANDWSQATPNYPLTTGDRIYTDQGGQAELEVGSLAVRVSESTDLTLANLNDQVMQLGIAQGTIRVRIYELERDEAVEVDTPNGALTLLRPGDYRVDTFPNDGATFVVVNRGGLEVSGGDVVQRVDSGQAVKLTGTEPIQVSLVEPPNPDGFDEWCRERDRRFESSESARYVGRSVPGYHDLDENGRWDEVPGYGPVWYPRGVQEGWVPYRYGRWVWISPWGWTWVEDEPWGFCPFHYGRWVFVGGYWGWVPGRVVVRRYYAPALVVFVGGPRFSVAITAGQPVGWFPLGPDEPYVPWYHYDNVYLRQVNVTNVRNVTNITNITNVTNVTNVTNQTNITNIHYMNRTDATTVVTTETFRSGQPVGRQVVHVDPKQLAQAQVIPHPRVVPAGNALAGGKPVAAPPVRVLRTSPTVAPGQRGAPSRINQPPVITKTPPSGKVEGGRLAPGPPSRTNGPPVITKTPPPEKAEGERPAPGPPPFITRRPLPPPAPPLEEREKAMEQHPGRPLEPQQIDNLRAGKPAGPMRDREVPEHPSQARGRGPSEHKQEKAKPKSNDKEKNPHKQ